MPLSDLANIAQVIASAAVVVSLVFISMQIRQSTVVSQAQAIAQTDHHWSILMEPLIHPETAELWIKGAVDVDALSRVDFIRFWVYCRNQFHGHADIFKQVQAGLLDETAHSAIERTIIFSSPGARAMWDIQKATFDPEFVKFQDELASKTPVISGASGRREAWEQLKDSYIKAAS